MSDNTKTDNNSEKVPATSVQTVVKEIDDNGFEEIKSIDKISTADTSMPQTGENDGFTFIGIAIFSVIAAVSFYKYKSVK